MLKLRPESLPLLRCPGCYEALVMEAEQLFCACGERYPILRGIPVLINEENSLFRIDDYAEELERRNKAPKPPTPWQRARRALPSLSANYQTEGNYNRFANLLLREATQPRVLVLGGRILGQGMESIAGHPEIHLIETDAGLGPRVQLVCDAHDVPFQDGTMDGVIIQAVLEHVCDPWRCVQEIHRVLKPGGLVYAETPFIQQVHGRAFDFTRFTDLGHRRLFRHFEQIDRGICCGPGMALAWSVQYFLLSFARRRWSRAAARIATELTLFWLKYVDRWLLNRPGSYDAASGFYFMGRKASAPLPDRELVKQWRGIE